MDKIEQIKDKVIGMTEEDSIKLISENNIIIKCGIY